MVKNFYEVLGVSKNDTIDTIKRSYRKLALQYHPDMKTGDKAKFEDIQNAYETLSDPQKKRQYDFDQSNPIRPMGGMGMMGGFPFEIFMGSPMHGGMGGSVSVTTNIQTIIKDGRKITIKKTRITRPNGSVQEIIEQY